MKFNPILLEFWNGFKECLNNALDLFRKNPARSKFIFCDISGGPRKIRSKEGQVIGLGRGLDVYDLFTLESCKQTFFTTRKLVMAQMDKKIDWMLSEIQ